MGGWSAVAGGVLLAIDVIAHTTVDDTSVPAELAGMPHEVWHIAGVVGIVLVLLGLMALYVRQAKSTGALGLTGFVLLMFGVVIGAAYSTVFHALFLPAVEQTQPGFFEAFLESTTAAQFTRGVIVQGVGLGLGAILFGIATIRAKVLPAAGGWLFIVAAVLAAANQLTPAAQLLSRGTFALGFIWMGWALARHPGASATS